MRWSAPLLLLTAKPAGKPRAGGWCRASTRVETRRRWYHGSVGSGVGADEREVAVDDGERILVGQRTDEYRQPKAVEKCGEALCFGRGVAR